MIVSLGMNRLERVGTPDGVTRPQYLADHGALNSQAKWWQGGSGIECEILGENSCGRCINCM